jgi:predicted  nucleic acid-binding Zn-ribbon protein
MEFKDIYYLLTIFGVAVSGIVWVRDQNGKRKGEIDLVKQDLQNHKDNHNKLEARVSQHEEKIDEKLGSIMEKLGEIKEDIAGLKK